MVEAPLSRAKTDRRKAEKARASLEARFAHNLARPDKPRAATLSQLCKAFEDHHAFGSTPATMLQYKNAGEHARAALGDIRVSKVTRASVRQIVRHLEEPFGEKKRRRSKATVRKVIVKLSTMFAWAVRQNMTHSNPFEARSRRNLDGLKLPKVQKSQKRIYSREEVAAFIARAPSVWWRAFITLAVNSGLRLDELLNLTWEDVSIPKARLTVAAKRTRSVRVGGRRVPILPFEAKSHQERSVPIGPDAVAALQELWDANDGSPYLFVPLERLAAIGAALDAGEPVPRYLVNNVLRDFKGIQRAAFGDLEGERRVGSVHDMRRTYCTWMADVVKAHRLKELAGHASITTTLEYYLAVDDALDDQIREALRLDSTAETDGLVTDRAESAESDGDEAGDGSPEVPDTQVVTPPPGV